MFIMIITTIEFKQIKLYYIKNKIIRKLVWAHSERHLLRSGGTPISSQLSLILVFVEVK